MATYDVIPNGLVDASGELENINRLLEESLGNLDQKHGEYVAANRGRAVDGGYVTAKLEWTKGMQEMKNALAGAQASLNRINESYQHTDAQGARLFGDLV